MLGCEVATALRFYTQSKGYLKNTTEGAERINLAGEPTGLLVTADEAADAAAAAKACQLRMERRREKQKAEAAQARVEESPKITEAAQLQEVRSPTILETAQPKKRLGLSDLKAAATARRQSNMENANA
jgi:sRNA-binding protein